MQPKTDFATIHLPDEAATRALGTSLADLCESGTAILLYGPLGAGKTSFAQALVAGLGGGEATSPTFVIAHRHPGGRLPVCHLDLYRLDDDDGARDIDLDHYVTPDAVAVVEWPERARDYAWPHDRLELHISISGNARIGRLRGFGKCAAMVDRVSATKSEIG
ncbi:MAG: tRNA (adenosine(37)-N6)-threonylcarbamoyltransferase complex ATPase subunit type 1 TsaE [Candidatus Eremiobacteraeota bacterium]|nr:tRNA (adenosine(37)-N6)-threonylcarbamoyltransferase complex ATPase subunit type 1 TsaE [Candidatus Eremiobacteraeota bacterium]MBC5828081.1 tRNA (adenosine(37)-N6)-threonylcarbamoyltransferase complex ATPase subunit type 1 TsaE [Candidatus Eremiobacteraeota bacterium]